MTSKAKKSGKQRMHPLFHDNRCFLVVDTGVTFKSHRVFLEVEMKEVSKVDELIEDLSASLGLNK